MLVEIEIICPSIITELPAQVVELLENEYEVMTIEGVFDDDETEFVSMQFVLVDERDVEYMDAPAWLDLLRLFHRQGNPISWLHFHVAG